MTEQQTLQSFEDLIRDLETNGVGEPATSDSPFNVFGDSIPNLTPENFYNAFGDSDIINTGSGEFSIIRNVDGSVRALDYTNNYGVTAQVSTLEDYLNSNTNAAIYSPSNNITYTTSSSFSPPPNESNINITGGVARYSGGALISQSQVTASGMLQAAPLAAGIGLKLGKFIDGAVYELSKELGLNPPEELNPETWAEVASQDGTGAFIFRTLFDIDPATHSMTQYADEQAIAYMSYWLKEQGFFDDGSYTVTIDDTTGLDMTGINLPLHTTGTVIMSGSSQSHNRTKAIGTSGDVQIAPYLRLSGDNILIDIYMASSSPFTWSKSDSYTGRTNTYSGTRVTYNNRTIYMGSTNDWFVSSTFTYDGPNNGSTIPHDVMSLYYILAYGTASGGSAIPGVTNTGGTIPDVSSWTSPSTTLTSLRQQFPDWFNNQLRETVTNPDGSTTTYNYIPYILPDKQTDGNPDTQEQDYTTEVIDPLTETQTKLQTIIELITNYTTSTLVDPTTSTQTGTNENNPTSNPNAPDTGTGTQSPFVAPTGSASSLWAVYHPSQAQLNAFGAWLWSSDFVDQLKRLFNDPMQAIIGVHKVFAPIPTGGSQNIKCGYLDSGVSSPVVSSQYTEVSCGTVNCREYFGNVFDYDPHTRVSIYLPFIGVVPLKVSEVMRASITVTYGVDVITGACLAKVKVDRDGGGAILYSFGGSCACHYPISAGSYAGIISGIVTSAVGVAGGIMSGSPLTAVGGVIAGARQAHTEVQHSGGFTGCAGAMGPKIPYLIITRPQTRVANDVQLYEGKPSNATQFIGDCTGFVRATEVHFSSQAAFNDEAKEVEVLLKNGVLISD